MIHSPNTAWEYFIIVVALKGHPKLNISDNLRLRLYILAGLWQEQDRQYSLATVSGGGQRERSGLGDQEIKAESQKIIGMFLNCN